MASDESPGEKLREYIQDLAPQARALLMSEIERALLRGEDVPQAQVLLRVLREAMQRDHRLPERIGNPARLFFAPVEPFIVDDSPEQMHYGRIPRASIGPIWEWIRTDIAAAQAAKYSEDVSRHLLAGDSAKAEQTARSFQDWIVRRIQEALGAVQADSKARRQLMFRVETPRAQADVQEFIAILKARDALTAIATRLPQRIRNLADDQLAAVMAVIESVLARQPDLFTYALVLVMGRLPVPWQLVRVAISGAQTDVAERIAESSYSIAVTIVLADIERSVRELKANLRAGQAIAAAVQLKDVHDAVRGLRAELDLSSASAWSRQLGSIRAAVADFLRPELEALPGRIRRLLRPQTGNGGRDGALDAAEVAEVEQMIGFLVACRSCASELALNEITTRVFADLQGYLENSTKVLLDSLRTGGPSAYRRSQLDAAVRFCGHTFGDEYATLLARAAEVAANSERKAAKA